MEFNVIFMEINGFSWILMDFNGVSWLLLDFGGFQGSYSFQLLTPSRRASRSPSQEISQLPVMESTEDLLISRLSRQSPALSKSAFSASEWPLGCLCAAVFHRLLTCFHWVLVQR